MSVKSELTALRGSLPENVTLVAVSKFHPVETIMDAYDAGQRIFGESRAQEMCAKQAVLPKDIRWHMIGHLQTNKVKAIAPFVDLIQSVDSIRLAEEINTQAAHFGRVIDVLFEIHVAREESKSGWAESDFDLFVAEERWRGLANIRPRGLMTIATQTDSSEEVKAEFMHLKSLFERYRPLFGPCFDTLSMGMTADYLTAVEAGSNMVRIGSLIFGERDYGRLP